MADIWCVVFPLNTTLIPAQPSHVRNADSFDAFPDRGLRTQRDASYYCMLDLTGTDNEHVGGVYSYDKTRVHVARRETACFGGLAWCVV